MLGSTKTKKKALIIDFIDQHEKFVEHSMNRIEVYEDSVGLENIVVLNAHDKDLFNQMRDFISTWFDL